MWFEERPVLMLQRAWDVAATTIAVIIFAFGIGLLPTFKAHAQDVITSEGIVCDTQEQVARYILAADAKATLASINEEKANSCAIVNVAYYIGDEGEKIVNTKGVWQITHILVIGTVMHGGVRSVSPTAQWTAFAIETASASLPILLVDNEDGVTENRWANSPYSAWTNDSANRPDQHRCCSSEIQNAQRHFMEEGFIPDPSYGAILIGSWVEGTPEKGWTGSVKLRRKREFDITTYRCTPCGYLES